ncbi:OB-fold domain-containing protein [Frankia sp. AiPs1]|uniref:Zn-ribbon domain-containing OB-fold protein n=1 Tax=Frankia sp. AiPs1 TaxID=573493 RepID=UPI002043BC39|nr:OB-fold domain-containing protein [Frankia sp. AiPs1]MCM3920356.1 OB-fold domain-containing protein [Frankia sp. AiPs1]
MNDSADAVRADAVRADAVRKVDPSGDVEATFWDGCSRREFWLQHCTACDAWQFYPRSLCSHCWAPTSELEWRRPAGGAVLESFSVVHRGSGPFAGYAPYVVALVRFDEGPIMMSNVVGDVEGLAIGDRLELDFAERAGRVVPVFTRAGKLS